VSPSTTWAAKGGQVTELRRPPQRTSFAAPREAHRLGSRRHVPLNLLEVLWCQCDGRLWCDQQRVYAPLERYAAV
jgi:hypothetical protein